MNLAVLGATGATGRLLCDQALAAGHTVAAVVRRPEAVGNRGLQLVKADVLDPQALEGAILGRDAVVWAVGGHDRLRAAVRGEHRASDLNSRGTRNVLHAMTTEGVDRLIVISSWGVGDSAPRLPFLFRRIVVPLLLRDEFADKARQEDVVRASALRWTVVRPTRLTDGPRTDRVRAGHPLPFTTRSHIARADVAAFVLRTLEQDTHVHETVEITN